MKLHRSRDAMYVDKSIVKHQLYNISTDANSKKVLRRLPVVYWKQ